MDDRSAKQLAVTISLIIFSLVTAYNDQLPVILKWTLPGVDPSGSFLGLDAKALVAAFGGLKLGVLILLLERFVLTVAAWPISGRWAYHSTSGNFGIVDITIQGLWAGGTVIDYSVHLYKTSPQVVSVLQRKSIVAPYDTATGLVTKLQGKKLLIVYEVTGKDHEIKAKRGLLELSPTPDKRVMKGQWESTRINDDPGKPDRNMRIGDLTLFRPERFFDYCKTLS